MSEQRRHSSAEARHSHYSAAPFLGFFVQQGLQIGGGDLAQVHQRVGVLVEKRGHVVILARAGTHLPETLAATGSSIELQYVGLYPSWRRIGWNRAFPGVSSGGQEQS